MTSDFPTISFDADFKKAVELLIDHPFLCVVSDDEYFEGIMTRRVMLKQLKRNIYNS